MKRWRLIPLCTAALAGILLFISCENNLLNFMFKNLFYESWKISSWSDPAPVVDGETHEQGDTHSNGFPMAMAMGSNGKIHLVAFKPDSSARDLIYSSLEPGDVRFEQSFEIVQDLSDNLGGIVTMPGIDLISDDLPIIVYSHGWGPYILSYQQYSTMTNSWDSEEQLLNNVADKITRTFVFFLASDLNPHIFYVTDETPNKMYHTAKVSKFPPIDPDPPEELISDIGPVAALRVGTSKVLLVYSDTARQNLYYRTYPYPAVSTVWSAPDSSVSIGEIGMALDSNDNIHVCFGTFNAADTLNPQYYTIRYIKNEDGVWTEMDYLVGSASSGPMAVFFPPSIAISQDTHGNDRVHMAYTTYEPPFRYYIWYAYYDEAGWQPSAQSLDTENTNSFWTFPLLAVDPKGTAHVVYSWATAEWMRTSMYIRGTPGEDQN